jgi:hypothetical protein
MAWMALALMWLVDAYGGGDEVIKQRANELRAKARESGQSARGASLGRQHPMAKRNPEAWAVRVRELGKAPWRVVDGVTNHISSPGWMHFYGRVTGVNGDGVFVTGRYERLDGREPMAGERDFFVRHFPFSVADGDRIEMGHWLVAKEAGTYRYVTVLGAMRTLRCLDYGAVVGPPGKK